MLENHLLHVMARVALRAVPPLRAKRALDAVGRLLPPLTREQAREVAARLAGRGTCLSRSLAVAARLPGAEIVIGGSVANGFEAHAWVEREGEALTETDARMKEIARMAGAP